MREKTKNYSGSRAKRQKTPEESVERRNVGLINVVFQPREERAKEN